MAIRNFDLTSQRGFRRVAAKNLPNFVVIAGPNGAGKSTLLYELFLRRNQVAEPGTRVSYTGPHRPWRKSTLTMGSISELPVTSFMDLLGMQTLPMWRRYAPEGLQHVGGQARSHDTSDESFSLLKLAIAQIEMRRLDLMQQVFERHNQSIPRGTMPDVYAPLRNAVRRLLPHLEFAKVDIGNPNSIRCLFRRVDKETTFIDIDDLSSGEKAVVGLLFPFLEEEMKAILSAGQEPPGTAAGPTVVPTALIDEPELHLHPSLQVSLIEYLRDLAVEGFAQFIIATHSPIILDALRQDELLMLVPLGLVDTDNQLVRVATSQERLETIRMLTGSTHVVTRCRPIVCLEGAPDKGERVSDRQVVQLLMPEMADWVLMGSGGRSEVIAAAIRLREALADSLPGMQVFALVDLDQGQLPEVDGVIPWPVCTLENLLLDSEAIWELLQPHEASVGLWSRDCVQRALAEIAQSRVQDEIRLRVLARIGSFHWGPSLTNLNETTQEFEAARDKLDQWVKKACNTMTDAINEAKHEVQRILQRGQELELFNGKAILHEFYNRYARRAGLSYPAFVYALARTARGKKRLRDLTEPVVSRVEHFIPKDLVATVEKIVGQLAHGPLRENASNLLEQLRGYRKQWEAGTLRGVDLGAIRGQLWTLANRLEENGLLELRMEITRQIPRLGPGKPSGGQNN